MLPPDIVLLYPFPKMLHAKALIINLGGKKINTRVTDLKEDGRRHKSSPSASTMQAGKEEVLSIWRVKEIRRGEGNASWEMALGFGEKKMICQSQSWISTVK